MRTIKQAHRRKLPIAVLDTEGNPVGAELVDEATYHVLALSIDSRHQNGGKISAVVAQGFVRPDGIFEFLPSGAVSQYDIFNSPDLPESQTTLQDFVTWCGGNIMRDVTGEKFLEYITDVLCWLPKAELTPGSPAHELQARGFFDVRDLNYTIEELRFSQNSDDRAVLEEWAKKKGTKEEMMTLLSARGKKPYSPSGRRVPLSSSPGGMGANK